MRSIVSFIRKEPSIIFSFSSSAILTARSRSDWRSTTGTVLATPAALFSRIAPRRQEKTPDGQTVAHMPQ